MAQKSTKMLHTKTADGGKGFMFYCPGCEIYHSVQVEKGPEYAGAPIWSWNGDLEKPTFEPSLLVKIGDDRQCHLFVRDGNIEYLVDSHHELRGQIIALAKEE